MKLHLYTLQIGGTIFQRQAGQETRPGRLLIEQACMNI